MDYFSKTKIQLLSLCKERGIKGYSNKKKDEIIKLLTVVVPLSPVVVPLSPVVVPEYKLVDLFAGTGGFTQALTSSANVVFANDMVASSKLIYEANHSHPLTLGDLNDINVDSDIPEHDILTGGFPCQPFSIAGKREGFLDKRSNVFWKILEILEKRQPAYFILENVKNLLTHAEGRTFQTILTSLQGLGYYVHHNVLNTATITGIPQHRERLYIVGLKSQAESLVYSLDFPTVAKRPLSDFLVTNAPGNYYYSARFSVWDLLRDNVVKHNTVYQYRRVYVRENKSGECPTLTANMGGGGHNVPLIRDEVGIRKLTPRECFNLQGFPSDYILPALADTHLYKLAGNAISVPVVRLIVNRLLEFSV